MRLAARVELGVFGLPMISRIELPGLVRRVFVDMQVEWVKTAVRLLEVGRRLVGRKAGLAHQPVER